jgi:hypothetical protein
MPSRLPRTTLGLFLVFQGFFALTSSGNAFRVPDEFEVYFQTEHLIDAGDLSIPQTLALRQPVIVNGQVVGTQSIFFGKVGRDGKPYAPYGPLTAFLALPHHLLGRAVAWAAGVPRTSGVPWTFLVGGITTLSSATAAALAVAGFHRAALAAGATSAGALLWSFLLGGTTVLWPYGSTLYSEAWQAAAFIWAAACLLEARTDERIAPRNVAIAAILLAAAVLTKPTSIVFAPGFLVAPLSDVERPLLARLKVAFLLSCGIGAAALIHLGWNIYRFGALFDLGYDWAETIPVLPARPFALADLPRGLVVLLLSPGKSLFLWAPALLFSLVAAREFLARHRGAALGVVTTSAVGLLLFAAYQFPEGGYAHGPRHLVPIVPLLLLPGAASRVRWSRAALGGCAAVGLTVAVLAASVSFLEDQSLGGDLGAGAQTAYYERIDPAAGRPWNRYRLDYLPFVDTIRSPQWRHATTLGQGPDFFPLHLLQLKASPGGTVIAPGLIYAWPLVWLVLLAGAVPLVFARPSVDGFQ